MRCPTRLMTTSVVLALFYLIFPQKAHAYLDPGTGSYVIQLLLATLFGAAFVVRLYWKNIKTFFANRFSKRPQDGKDDE